MEFYRCMHVEIYTHEAVYVHINATRLLVSASKVLQDLGNLQCTLVAVNLLFVTPFSLMS